MGVVGPVAAGEVIVPDSDGGWVFVEAGDGFLILLRRGGIEPMWRPLPKGAFLKEQNALLGSFVLKNPSSVG